MRKLATAFALVSLTLATACGGDSETEPAAQPAGSEASESGSSAGSSSATESESPDASPSTGATAGAQTLAASVGTEGDPNAFVITLTDQEGQPIESLPAGDYTVEVVDPSAIHNFHLTGPGGVNESTTVPGMTETTWQVTLEEGDYTYVCDPHPSMVGGFTVTARAPQD
jgi:plastocyanin